MTSDATSSQPPGTAVVAEPVRFPLRGQPRDAYLALPEGVGPFPGVVVIHEYYGLNDNIRDVARRLARAGYAALAVDLFAGRNRAVCMVRFMSHILTRPLDNASLDELKAALTWLGERPEVDATRLGAIGFCMGGSFAIAWACVDQRLQVIAPFYGMNPRPLEATRRMCPVVASYPDKDITTGSGRKLDAELTAAGVPHDFKTYPNTKHGFFNDQSSIYDPAASADAWARIMAFFDERLGASAGGS
ncbi:MAG TPA: dienelactone hydrolase family protein [Ktedonobacterales bacterium]|nr:dienelactone hydrolase family protein [Ktedonobacterales bacterium]